MSRMLTCCALAGWVALAGSAAGCGSTAPRGGTPEAFVREKTVVIAPGKMVELNLEVPASTLVAAVPVDPIDVSFEAGAPLAWNVHEHPEGGVQILAQGLDADKDIKHTPSHPGPISLLWENRSEAPISVAIHVLGLPAATTAEWYLQK